MNKIAVIVLNWNGEKDSLACINALKKQTQNHTVVVVDNGSTDNFCEIIRKDHPEIILLVNSKNLGFACGVNTGIRYAIKQNYSHVALINNDATPEPIWLSELLKPTQTTVQARSLYSYDATNIGIITGKLLKTDGTIDSTGEQYASWGLAFPRGRGENDNLQYNTREEVFGATGGASLYRVSMLKEIGLFDEDFFAYYEDVDLSFRAQLTGWKVIYTPKAIAHHKIGASSSKVPGLTTYMTIKNLPWLFWKNVPIKLIPTLLPRFAIVYTFIVLSSLAKGRIIPVVKGLFVTNLLLPKKLLARHKIQKSRKVSAKYIQSVIIHDLPPNAHKLRALLRPFSN